MKPTIKLIIDDRRQRKDGTYPIKIRVTYQRRTKDYPLLVYATVIEYNEITSSKPSKASKEVKLKMDMELGRAIQIAASLKVFSFEDFDKCYANKRVVSNDVFGYYTQYIDSLKKAQRDGTAENYSYSLKSLRVFLVSLKGREVSKLSFEDLTVTWLNDYEQFMLLQGKTRSTIGIYLRPLRSIYNLAISEGNASKEAYPFGHRKYKIPGGKKAKKAVDKGSLKLLLEVSLPSGSNIEKARDFWFFSYTSNGMNLKDICALKWSNIDAQRMIFVRGKTALTTKQDQQEIVVHRTQFINDVISKYSINVKGNTDGYVFPIYTSGMSSSDRLRVSKNFVSSINWYMKKLAKSVGLEGKISFNSARHSFTTNAIRSGASMEMIQESLGHQNIKTTQNYWAGFDDLAKKNITDQLMNFD